MYAFVSATTDVVCCCRGNFMHLPDRRMRFQESVPMKSQIAGRTKVYSQSRSGNMAAGLPAGDLCSFVLGCVMLLMCLCDRFPVAPLRVQLRCTYEAHLRCRQLSLTLIIYRPR
jgi:hypothetical protein